MGLWFTLEVSCGLRVLEHRLFAVWAAGVAPEAGSFKLKVRIACRLFGAAGVILVGGGGSKPFTV
jgi:hypothetical protein